MANYIETKITYNKMLDNGTVKKTTESYLVDAMSFTEAEARIIKERQPYISGAFDVQAVKKTKIAEIVPNDDADKFYAVKWTIISIDEKAVALGKPVTEKKIAVLSLVQAYSVQNALDCFSEHMKGTVLDYDVVSVAETVILDIYPVIDDPATETL